MNTFHRTFALGLIKHAENLPIWRLILHVCLMTSCFSLINVSGPRLCKLSSLSKKMQRLSEEKLTNWATRVGIPYLLSSLLDIGYSYRWISFLSGTNVREYAQCSSGRILDKHKTLDECGVLWELAASSLLPEIHKLGTSRCVGNS